MYMHNRNNRKIFFKEVNQVVNGNVKAMDGIESPKSDMTSRK